MALGLPGGGEYTDLFWFRVSVCQLSQHFELMARLNIMAESTWLNKTVQHKTVEMQKERETEKGRGQGPSSSYKGMHPVTCLSLTGLPLS